MLIFFGLFLGLVPSVSSIVCNYEDYLGYTRELKCPGITDTEDKIFCCGMQKSRYCCNGEELANYATTTAFVPLLVGLLVTGLIVSFIIVIIACFCCKCCYLAKRRTHQQGHVLGPASTTMVVTSAAPYSYPPQQQQYIPHQQQQYIPPQQSANYPPPPGSYPPQSAPYPPQYPVGDNNPAYNPYLNK